MKPLIASVALALAAALTLAGCGSSPVDPVPAPVTVELDQLEGQTVDVPVGSVLNINVGEFDVASVMARIDDPAIGEFVPGGDDGSAEFNPGVLALSVGQTEVTLTHEQGEFDAVQFVLVVTE